jgi:RNA polymerase sigma factor (sigma-70 family)
VLSFLWLFGVTSEADREDVSQEVWTDVYRSLPIFDPSRGSARAWLAGIARNAARDWKRTRQRRPEFSTHTDREPIAMGTAEMDAADAERCAALWAYFERAIPNEDQREAFMLHVVHELTIEEVAETTGAQPNTVRWRIAMARRRLKEEMTEEERRKLAAILPVMSVDAFVRALRETKFPEDSIARVWERVSERIEAEGGSVHDPLGTPATAPSPPAPKGYTFTGPGLASAFAGVFLLGAVSGATALYAFLSRDQRASMTTIDAEIPPAPILTAAPTPEPTAPTSAAPSVRSSTAAAPPTSEALLLERARKAEPAEALALAEQHAWSFPRSSRAVDREEIAIYALLQLNRRTEAEARAAKLVRWAPKKRPEMEALFGRSLL